ncbi:MAG: hypothetical protein BWY26_00893 [Elusimicrobia bacterium ADurb.Bin231]|nr:MAG: hypothetical protein BWY26_00893 [Elusimicrobia bacterium ADurb.Bin231]
MRNVKKYFQRAALFIILSAALLMPWRMRCWFSEKLFLFNKKHKGKLDSLLFD